MNYDEPGQKWEEDAVMMGNLFKEQLHYPEKNVKVLRSPTLVEVRAELDLFQGKMNKHDIFIFFYSGHGEESKGDKKVLELQLKGDFPLRYPELKKKVNEMSKRVTYILDSCYS